MVSNLQFDLTKTEEKLAKALSENVEILKQFTDKEEQKENLQKQLLVSLQKIEELEKAIVGMKDIHINQFRDMEQSHEEQLSNLHGNIKNLMSQLNSSVEEGKFYSMTNNSLLTEKSKLQEKCSDYSVKVESLEKLNVELNQKVTFLENMNTAVQQKVTFLEETYQSVQHNTTTELSHLQSKLQDIFKEKSDLELKVIRMEQDKTSLATQHANLLINVKKEHDLVLEGCRQDRAVLITSYEEKLQQTIAQYNENLEQIK